MTSLAPHMEAFLREHLVRHRGNSAHTCDSYAYSFQSLFEFASQKLKVAPSALMLEQLDASLISTFLEYLESTRGNSAETRNIRLAAIRSFFRFLQHREPAAIEQVRRVLAIPFKKTDHRLVPYLAQEEMQALLDAPDPSTRMGVRDRAILHLAICPVSESRNSPSCASMMSHPNRRVSACGAKAVANVRCLFGRRRLRPSALGWPFEDPSHPPSFL